jgi:hypothetical protein
MKCKEFVRKFADGFFNDFSLFTSIFIRKKRCFSYEMINFMNGLENISPEVSSPNFSLIIGNQENHKFGILLAKSGKCSNYRKFL